MKWHDFRTSQAGRHGLRLALAAWLTALTPALPSANAQADGKQPGKTPAAMPDKLPEGLPDKLPEGLPDEELDEAADAVGELPDGVEETELTPEEAAEKAAAIEAAAAAAKAAEIEAANAEAAAIQDAAAAEDSAEVARLAADDALWAKPLEDLRPQWPADFFAYTITERPIRELYGDLSDTEYAGLDRDPRFYAIVLARYPDAALDEDTYFSDKTPEYAKDRDVMLQGDLLVSPDPVLRGHAVTALVTHGNRVGNAMLVERLEAEPDVSVTVDLLRAVRQLDGVVDPERLLPYLVDRPAAVRLAAVRLYGQQEAPAIETLQRIFQGDPDARIRLAALEGLARHVSRTSFAWWRPLLDAEAGADVTVCAIAPALHFMDDFGKDPAKLSEQLRNHASPAVRVALVQALAHGGDEAMAVSELTAMATDLHSAVRLSVAEACGVRPLAPLQPVLVALSQDAETEIRLAAVTALRHYPDQWQASLPALLDAFDDPASVRVRNSARESTLILGRVNPVDAALGGAVASDSELVRYHTCRLLSDLGSAAQNEAVHRQLALETNPDNLSAVIRSLAVGGDASAGEAIYAHHAHASELVREAVAEAIWRLRLPQGYRTLTEYSLTDVAATVRAEAIEGMGRIVDPRFEPALRTILMRTNYARAEILSAGDRAMAIWALHCFPSLEPKTVNRLRDLATKAVVIIPMSPPSFDSENVRVSSVWTLAIVGKRLDDAKLLKLADTCITSLTRVPAPDEVSDSAVGDNSQYFARQASWFLSGAPYERDAIAPSTSVFNYRLIETN